MSIKFFVTPAKLKNEKVWPKTYTRKFIEQGLVDYADMKLGALLLKKETIDKMLASFQDKPVIIKHTKVDESNFVDLAVGYIKTVYFNPNDGWYYVDFLITHDEGHICMDNGWGVSCAYTVQQLGEGGKWHNIEYQGEILAGIGEHLALVQNPRYEDCLMVINQGGKIQEAVLCNEKNFITRRDAGKQHQQGGDIMAFKLFGKKQDNGFTADSLIDIGNGVKVKVADLISAHNSISETHELAENQEIELANGKKVALLDLVNAWKLANKATAEGEETDEEKAAKLEEAKKAENALKMKNCGCGGKDGKHEDKCTMYNADGSEKEKKDEKLENAVKAAEDLRVENAALKEAIANGKSFIKVGELRKTGGNAQTELDLAIQNGNATMASNSMESKVERARKYFTPTKR